MKNKQIANGTRKILPEKLAFYAIAAILKLTLSAHSNTQHKECQDKT